MLFILLFLLVYIIEISSFWYILSDMGISIFDSSLLFGSIRIIDI